MPSLKEKTARGLLWGGLNNGVQQVLNLLFGIFLARELTPSDYGMVGMLAVFSVIATTLQESGFTAALVNKREERHEDYNAVFWFSILMSLGLYIFLFICAPLIARYYHNSDLIPLARYSFIGFVLSAMGTAQSAVLFKHMMVKQRAISQITALIISGCIGVSMAYNGFSYWGIATQNIVYVGVTTLLYWYFSPWCPTFNINLNPLREMFGFSSKLLATRFFYHINNHLFTIILGGNFTKDIVGFYTQGYKWSSMGGQLMLGMITNVSQPVLSEVSNDKERQQRVFCKMLSFTSFISFPVMFGLGLISKELIWITITDKWLPCVPIIQLLCISGAFVPINSLQQQLLISKGKSNLYLWNTVCMCIALLVTCMCTYSFGLIPMLTAYVSVSICGVFVWFYFVKKEIDLSLTKFLINLIPFMCIALITMIFTWYITRGMDNIVLLFSAKIVFAIIIYSIIIWIYKPSLLKECIVFFLHKIRIRK